MVQFVDEPPRRTRLAGDPAYAEVAEELMENPGVWALAIPSAGQATSGQIRRGDYRAFRPIKDWEVTHRKNTSGLYDVYIRYVGHEMARLGFGNDKPPAAPSSTFPSDVIPESDILIPPDLIPEIQEDGPVEE